MRLGSSRLKRATSCFLAFMTFCPCKNHASTYRYFGFWYKCGGMDGQKSVNTGDIDHPPPTHLCCIVYTQLCLRDSNYAAEPRGAASTKV